MNIKTLILIYKGLLLWVTVLFLILSLAGGLESLLVSENWIAVVVCVLMNIILCYLCYTQITYKELYILSGIKLFEKFLK